MSGVSEEANLNKKESEKKVSKSEVDETGKKLKSNFCYVCKVQCTAPRNFIEHQQGKKHLKNLTLAELQKKKSERNKSHKNSENKAVKKSKHLKSNEEKSDKLESHDSQESSTNIDNSTMNNSNRYDPRNRRNHYPNPNYENRYSRYQNSKYYYSSRGNQDFYYNEHQPYYNQQSRWNAMHSAGISFEMPSTSYDNFSHTDQHYTNYGYNARSQNDSFCDNTHAVFNSRKNFNSDMYSPISPESSRASNHSYHSPFNTQSSERKNSKSNSPILENNEKSNKKVHSQEESSAEQEQTESDSNKPVTSDVDKSKKTANVRASLLSRFFSKKDSSESGTNKRSRSRSLSNDKSPKDKSESQSLHSDNASEEQKIKEWTDSFLDTHNKISRLLHPSSYKEKAAVNHLVTKFSKSKRNENLTRNIRSNSIGSGDANDDGTGDVNKSTESLNLVTDEISIISDSNENNSFDFCLEPNDSSASAVKKTMKISERTNSDQGSSNQTLVDASVGKSSDESNLYRSYKTYNKWNERCKESGLRLSKKKFLEDKRAKRLSSNSDKTVKRKSSSDDTGNKEKKKKVYSSTECFEKNSASRVPDLRDVTVIDESLIEISLNPSDNLKATNHVSSEAIPAVKEELPDFSDSNLPVTTTPADSQNVANQSLELDSSISVETLIQLFASGNVRVKEEFNDPIMDAIKEISQDELMNACSNQIFPDKGTESMSNTPRDSNLQNLRNSSSNVPMDSNLQNSRNSSSNVPMDSNLQNSRNSSSNVPMDSNLQNSRNSSSNVPMDCNLQSSRDKSTPTVLESTNTVSPITLETSSATVTPLSATNNNLSSDMSNEQNLLLSSKDNEKTTNDSVSTMKTHPELPSYVNKLIKQLQEISSEEEIVKTSLSEAKSKISEINFLLEEWRRKKAKLEEQEEELRKQRNVIIKSLQNAVESGDQDGKESKNSTVQQDATNQPAVSSIQTSSVNIEIIREKFCTPTSVSLPEKSPKQKKSKVSLSPESDEITILPPPVKPKPPEIIIDDEIEASTSASHSRSKDPRREIVTNVTSSNESSFFNVKTISAHVTVVNSLVVFEDFLYTCSNDNTGKRFNLKDASLSVTYHHTAKNVTEIVVEKVQSEPLVMTSCSTRVISLFIASSGTKLKTFFQPCAIMSICRGWGKFYAGLANGTVNVYNWKYEERELVKTDSPASRIDTAHQGRLHVLVILSSDGNIAIRDAETGLLIRCIKIYVKHPSWMIVYNDLAYLSSADKILIILDIMSGRVEKRLYLNTHTTGLAIYEDYIFTISYTGLINCLNKDNSCDKKVYFGAGKNGLTCVHIYQDWVFTGNRKGTISLFQFDPHSTLVCEFGKCDIVYGLEEDLEYHVWKDHLSKKKTLSKCCWRGCDCRFPVDWNLTEKMDHFRKHIYETHL